MFMRPARWWGQMCAVFILFIERTSLLKKEVVDYSVINRFRFRFLQRESPLTSKIGALSLECVGPTVPVSRSECIYLPALMSSPKQRCVW